MHWLSLKQTVEYLVSCEPSSCPPPMLVCIGARRIKRKTRQFTKKL